MATWIIFGLLLLAMFFAIRYAFRKARRGECVGCPGSKSGGCCHCRQQASPKAQ